ncbi:MAG: lytic transglycosylase domain-containing protein [Desulfuromonadales bacterium]|nr:lytic transglycosylase domain-containing protein [Desulfuromonadales bacterium]
MLSIRQILLCGVILVPFFVGIAPADADIYRYIDASGRMQFTDTPTHGRWDMYLKESPPAGSEHPSYVEIIRRHASFYRLEEALVKAVIKVESDYQPRVVSKKGAQGLMQLIPETAKSLKVSNPFDPSENIRGGSEYLRRMLDLFNNDIELALAAYNSGPSTVQQYGGIPPYNETRNYVKKVKHYLDYYRQSADTLL